LATSASKYTAGNPDRLDDVALEQATKSDECLAILPLELLISKQKQSPKRFGDSPPERSLTGGHKFLLQVVALVDLLNKSSGKSPGFAPKCLRPRSALQENIYKERLSGLKFQKLN
jgi:hypothetical protein